MDVWLTWCKRKSKCRHCGEYIQQGEPVVVGKLWSKERKWPMQFRWHPKCWLDQALAYLEKHPYIPRLTTGRPKLELSDVDRKQRAKLLRQRATLCYQQRKAALAGNAVRVLHLEVKKQELIDQMPGPVPKSWRVHHEEKTKANQP